MDKSALFNLSYGLYIVSTRDGSRDVGCVVNSVFQVTSSPATLAVSINKGNYTNPCLIKNTKFAISVLSENVPENVIGNFGFSSSKDNNKFENVEFITVENGCAVLKEGICSYIECQVIKTVDCFTHTLIVAEITNAENMKKEPPMTYSYYHKVIKGKSPKNAPTFVEEVSEPDSSKYVCSICGYEYPGTREEFEALPDSYSCPLCNAPKSLFVLQ